MRILQLGMTDNLGGIEAFLMNYYRHIDRSRIQFDFINIYENSLCFQDEIKRLGGRIFSVPSYYKHPIKYIKKVKEIINSNHYEIIHCNMNSAAMIFPLIAGKISNATTVISHAHNSSSDSGILKQILHTINKKFIPYLANVYFSCSNEASKWFYGKKIRQGDNHYIIYNAVDTNRFKYNKSLRKELRDKFGIKDGDLVLGHIGRFVKQKNQKWLIEKFKKELIGDELKLVLVGQGQQLNQIKDMVNEKDLNKKVIFLNPTPHIEKIYNIFDVFIMPSLYEGLPNTAIEAQCNGVPTLLSNKITREAKIRSNCEYFSLGDSGLDLYKKIKRLNRENNSESELDSFKDFDICQSVQHLSCIYENKINEKE